MRRTEADDPIDVLAEAKVERRCELAGRQDLGPLDELADREYALTDRFREEPA